MMLSAETLLPHPDSPTRATVSPSATSHDTSSTARTMPALVLNWVLSERTSRRGVTIARECTTAGVDGRPHGAGRPCASPSRGNSLLLTTVFVVYPEMNSGHLSRLAPALIRLSRETCTTHLM